MHSLAKTLYPLHRSITGDNNRRSLEILQKHIPLTVHEVQSGTKVFDWTIPKEWKVNRAFIKDQRGNTLVDINVHNLHILSYSIPFSGTVTFEELDAHLYHLKDHPDWIPYRTCYYGNTWGFCLTYNQYMSLDRSERYEVVIDSVFYDGSLSYGELVIHGESEKEILISTYICHPSMCNDNLSGIVVATHLAKYIMEKGTPRYTYRFVFVPESIGAIAYLAMNNADVLKQRVIGGYVLTCLGDSGEFTYLKTRNGNALVDKVTLFALNSTNEPFKVREFYTCGSDERQYNYPSVDMDIGSLMRTKYMEFPEYHTSADDLNFISEENLQKSLQMYIKCVDIFESNRYYTATTVCEPRLGVHGLFQTVGGTKSTTEKFIYVKILYYCDGKNDVIDICEAIHETYDDVVNGITRLENVSLIRRNINVS